MRRAIRKRFLILTAAITTRRLHNLSTRSVNWREVQPFVLHRGWPPYRRALGAGWARAAPLVGHAPAIIAVSCFLMAIFATFWPRWVCRLLRSPSLSVGVAG